MPCNNPFFFLFCLWINYCALYQDSASLILNIVNIVTVFPKNADNEKEQLPYLHQHDLHIIEKESLTTVLFS